MCEFCLDPSGKNNRDQFHPSFAGFFSADAIEAAVRQVNADRQRRKDEPKDEDGEDDDADSDGT